MINQIKGARMKQLYKEFEMLERLKSEIRTRFTSPFVNKAELLDLIDEFIKGKRLEIKERKKKNDIR